MYKASNPDFVFKLFYFLVYMFACLCFTNYIRRLISLSNLLYALYNYVKDSPLAMAVIIIVFIALGMFSRNKKQPESSGDDLTNTVYSCSSRWPASFVLRQDI
jgi:hypothetical protein